MLAAGCTSKRPGDDVAATVDGRKIYRADVEKYYQNQTRAPTSSRSASRPPACALAF